ncbi:MAG TPA: hypothetical protein VE662_06100 [Solirubrobacterales bacterium]|nr:hypothetical protein [Solirubrobacterales bacterium]
MAGCDRPTRHTFALPWSQTLLGVHRCRQRGEAGWRGEGELAAALVRSYAALLAAVHR